MVAAISSRTGQPEQRADERRTRHRTGHRRRFIAVVGTAVCFYANSVSYLAVLLALC